MKAVEAVWFVQLPLMSSCWRGLYVVLTRRLKDDRAADSLVSFVHSVVIVLLILLTEGPDSRCMLRAADADNTTQQQFLLMTSLSYFIHDTLKSGWEGWRMAMLLHHVGGLVFLSLPLVTGRYGACTVQALLYLEASNPCFHARRILAFFGTRGRLYTLLEVLYVSAFAYFRFIPAFILTTDVLINRDYMSPFYILGAVFFQMVSTCFMAYIFHHVLSRYIHPGVRRLSNFIADEILERAVS